MESIQTLAVRAEHEHQPLISLHHILSDATGVIFVLMLMFAVLALVAVAVV